jgi:ethanolamine utilization cobalamin adenosyltransferase
MIITEYELRARWHKDKCGVITVPQGSVVTPAARDFLRDRGIQVRIEGDGVMDLNRINYSSTMQSLIASQDTPAWTNHMRPADGAGSVPTGAPFPGSAPPCPDLTPGLKESGIRRHPGEVKPEHMTYLHGSGMVCKNHPIIALRGQLDLFQCELMEAELWFLERGEQELAAQMEEIADFARQLMVAEVRQQTFEISTLIGYTADELREMSHHPDKYFGVRHTNLSVSQGPVAIRLHCLRSKAREVELYANKAFCDQQGVCSRSDIIRALNRLSSAFYILACKARARHENQSRPQQSGV